MYLPETHSTNSLLHSELTAHAQWLQSMPIPCIRTDYQTAGRGQMGNGWESERGQNLLCSFALRAPEVAVAAQYRLSMLAATALHKAIIQIAPSLQDALAIKWPNDLYYADSKLAGILIENRIEGGHIAYSVVGIGLNVNQQAWSKSIPNPTSLRLLTRQAYDIEPVLTLLLTQVAVCLAQGQGEWETYYMQHLYRREGMHPYVEREVSLAPTTAADDTEAGVFYAAIQGIDACGGLVLQCEDGQCKTYHFKEIRYVLPKRN